MIICELNEIKIRLLEDTEEDMIILTNWFNNEEVSKYYGGIDIYTIEKVTQKYSSKIKEENVYPCMIEYNNKPIGYIQFYKINNEIYEITKEDYDKLVSSGKTAMAIDLFIGDTSLRNKGIGTKILKLLIKTIFEKYDTDVILIDPKVNNPRAISCYKKSGFIECFIIKNREKMNGILYDNVMMKIEK